MSRRPHRTRRGRPLSRRGLLQALGVSALSAPLWRPARADEGVARRIIFFYFPDGVVGPSAEGEASLWHPSGGEHDFDLPSQLEPLEPLRDRCLFFRGLSMGGTDSGSHPGGAKKLLTAVDHGAGRSIDQHLAHTVGAGMPWRHLYLGAMANQNGASGDKHISYVAPGSTVPPEDDPRRAFESLFGSAAPPADPGGGDPDPPAPDPTQVSVLDGVIEELIATRSRLGEVERSKLDLHLEALREVELRVTGGTEVDPEGVVDQATCAEPSIDTGGFGDSSLYDAAAFPAILRAQIDLMVLAMSCGLTRVGTIQASHHTSELIMSRFEGTEMHDPGFDMRSHQASHYGPRHDFGHREFADFHAQRRWFVSQFAYLLQRLADTPEGDSDMLANSVVVLCSEVCDGNTHLHDDMPFILAGNACGRISTGRLVDTGTARHGALWAAAAHAMGEYVDGWGDGGGGVLGGVLS